VTFCQLKQDRIDIERGQKGMLKSDTFFLEVINIPEKKKSFIAFTR